MKKDSYKQMLLITESLLENSIEYSSSLMQWENVEKILNEYSHINLELKKSHEKIIDKMIKNDAETLETDLRRSEFAEWGVNFGGGAIDRILGLLRNYREMKE